MYAAQVELGEGIATNGTIDFVDDDVSPARAS
jgi:hypothetical protein